MRTRDICEGREVVVSLNSWLLFVEYFQAVFKRQEEPVRTEGSTHSSRKEDKLTET